MDFGLHRGAGGLVKGLWASDVQGPVPPLGGLGFRVWGLGFWVWGLGSGVWGLGCCSAYYTSRISDWNAPNPRPCPCLQTQTK